MPEFEKTVTLKQDGDRNSTRRKVVLEFMEEEPGTGRGNYATHYKYYVERLRDGRKVYLTRPAWLKVGFDFLIHVEGETFINGKDNPSHDDIIQDLVRKKEENTGLFRRLCEMIKRVFDCEDPDDFHEDYDDINFEVGLPSETILKVLKWFFIEQDIRFWNYSGRNMLMRGIEGLLREE